MNNNNKYKNSNNGISLISLIIVIIVIIILAAIVIFTGLNTPDKANFAKFTQQVDNIQTALNEEYYKKKTKYALENKTRSDAQTYYIIASGKEEEVDINTDTSTLRVGTIAELNIDIKPTDLQGNEYYEISANANIAGVKDNKGFYSTLGTVEHHYITDKGEFFILPGYPVDDAGTTRWYVNAQKYYLGDTPKISFNTDDANDNKTDSSKGKYVSISSKSTGPFDASLKVTIYDDEEVIESTDIIYTEVSGTNKYSNEFVEIGYNGQWEVTLLKNVKYNKPFFKNEKIYKYSYLFASELLTFLYTDTVDFSFYPIKEQEIKLYNEQYIENIYTYSAGGFDASLQLDKYEDDVLISSENILYTSVRQGNVVSTDLVEISYNQSQTSWTIVALKDIFYKVKNSNTIKYLPKGESIKFAYSNSVNYEFYNSKGNIYELLDDEEFETIDISSIKNKKNVYTYSTGDYNASLQFDEYYDDHITTSENILYTSVSQSNPFRTDLVDIYYNQSQTSWTIVALKDIIYKVDGDDEMYILFKGQKIQFTYSTTANYEFYEINI